MEIYPQATHIHTQTACFCILYDALEKLIDLSDIIKNV